MLVDLTSVLNEAKEGKYAIGAFNIYDYGTIRGVIESARELEIPVILAFGERYVENMDFETVYAIVNSLVKNISIPVVLHLDHCRTFENIIKAIRAGFTSVMFDGSALSFKENLLKTKQIVSIAHAVGVSVEGELGSISAGEGSIEEGGEEIYTDPVQAREFVNETGIDALAVAIGTVHGLYKGEPRINIEVLRKVALKVDIPLVLHGGSGTPPAIIKECIRNGICKINVNTDVSIYTLKKINSELKKGKVSHLSQMSLKEIEYVKEVAKKYMLLFYDN